MFGWNPVCLIQYLPLAILACSLCSQHPKLPVREGRIFVCLLGRKYEVRAFAVLNNGLVLEVGSVLQSFFGKYLARM